MPTEVVSGVGSLNEESMEKDINMNTLDKVMGENMHNTEVETGGSLLEFQKENSGQKVSSGALKKATASRK